MLIDLYIIVKVRSQEEMNKLTRADTAVSSDGMKLFEQIALEEK